MRDSGVKVVILLVNVATTDMAVGATQKRTAPILSLNIDAPPHACASKGDTV